MPIGTTAAIIGGISAAGSLASGVSSLFGGDDERGKQIRQLYEERYKRLKGQDPSETAQFTAGVGELQEQTREQAERDASQAAARGLTGSQYEVAQDASRAEALASGTRELLRQSASSLQRRRQSALAGLAQQTNRQIRREEERKSRLGQIAGTALQAGTQFALAGGGGGGGGG